jgi:hypothetical protein
MKNVSLTFEFHGKSIVNSIEGEITCCSNPEMIDSK